MFRVLILFFAIAPQSTQLFAAQHGGSVRWGNRPVPGATVTATLGDKKVLTATDDDGAYAFADLAPGEWRIEVDMFGFTPRMMPLRVDAQAAPLDFTLELKPRASKPAASPGPSSDGDFVALTLNSQQSDDLIHEGPEPLPADADDGDAFLVTGSVSRGLEEARKEQTRYGRTGAAGGTSGNGVATGPEGAAAEAPDPSFRSRSSKKGGEKSERKASIGRKKGSSPRKSASIGNRRQKNDIRGSLSWTLRNSVLDARAYSLSGQTQPKPSYAQGRIAFSAGGALKIPHIFESDSTFVYFTYSGHRNGNPYDTVSTLASPLERGGDFSRSVARGPVGIYDPLSNQPFAGNVIPKSRINPAATGLLAFIPLPTFAGTVQNYQYLTAADSHAHNYGVRLNQTVTRRDRLAFNVNTRVAESELAQPFRYDDSFRQNTLSATASYTRNLGPRSTNNLSWSLNRSRNESTPYFAYKEDVAAQLGIAGVSGDPRNWGPPNLSFTNFGALTDGTPALRRLQTVRVSDGVTLTRRGHTLTFGGSIRRMQVNTLAENGRGGFSFSGLITSGLDENRQPLANTGFDFADFLLGFPQSSSIRFGSANTYFRAQAYDGHFNDDWRVNRSVSFNLGLRYEYFTPYKEKFGKIANLDIAPGFTGVAVVTPGGDGPYTGSFPDALINPDWKVFSPRAGMALRPRKIRNLTIRAGYGLFFNGSIYSQFPSRLASQPPFATTGAATTSTANVLTLQNGFASAPNQNVTNTYAVDKDYRVPYVQTWNFTLQRSLPHGLFVSLGYLGNKGTRLDIQRQPNRAAPGGSPLTAEQRRQIGNATGFTYVTSIGNSVYHSMDAQITRRFQKGVSVSLHYVYGKAIDNAASFGGGVAQDDYNLRAERGLSGFDIRHNLSTRYYLVSPVGERGLMRNSRWAGRLLADWSLSGTTSLTSGTPLTARVLGNRSNTGGAIGSGRADATGADVDEGPGYFNPLAFSIPAPGRFGNAGRNTILGPSRFTGSLGLSRSFKLGPDSRRRIEFRFESANFLNHVMYNSLGTVVNASNYGLPLSTGAMRSHSATLRLRF